MTINIILVNYNSLFDEEFYFMWDKSIQVLPGKYNLLEIKKIIHQIFKINVDFDLFACANNTEPFILNTLKLNNNDVIHVDKTGQIILFTKSKNYILSCQLTIRTHQLLENLNIKKVKRQVKLKKLSEYEKIIFDYHPHRLNLSRYPLLILSRL